MTAHVGDGRNFLTQRTDKFDVIVSQPSNPWLTGVSNLFTREYFRDIKRRLAPGGIFCQWAQLYELAPWNIKTIYRTVRDEFRYVYVFSAEDLSSDTILVASQEPLKLDLGAVERALSHPETRAEARRGLLESPHDVFAYLLLAPDELDSFTTGSPINTDDNARIEFSAPRDLLGYAKFDPYLAKVYGPLWPYGHLTEVITGYDGPDQSARCGGLGRSLLAHGKAREAELWTRRAEAAGDSPEARQARLLLQLVSTRLDRDPEIPLAPADGLAPPRPREHAKLTAEHAARGRRISRGAGGGERATLRHRLQDPRQMARVAVDRPGAGLQPAGRVPRLQSRAIRRRRRRTEAAVRRPSLRGAAPGAVLLPGPFPLRECQLHQGGGGAGKVHRRSAGARSGRASRARNPEPNVGS